MFTSRHRTTISVRNAFNSTTTIVTPPTCTNAGNINNTLLPDPVGITITIGLSPYWIVCIASPYTLRIVTFLYIIYYNSAIASIRRNTTCRSVLASSASSSNGQRLCFNPSFFAYLVDWNPKKRYQSTLIARNCCYRLAIVPTNSYVSLAYTAPATYRECVACSSAISPDRSSCNQLLSSWCSSVTLSTPFRIHRWLITIAIWRYPATLID
jgi:hypothetical protein